MLLSARISNAQEAEQGATGVPNPKSSHAVSSQERSFYPTPSNYKNFKYHALIIGIDGSGSTCHEPFASQLAAFLKKWRCFSNGSITVLKGRAGTQQRIQEAITNLHLGLRDVLIVYYGGHGDSGGIVTSDHQYLSPAALSAYMQQSGAGFKVLLVDACYSGIFVRPGENGRGFQRNGFAAITAAEENETSTYEGVGFGPYLWQLLNMKRGDSHRVITLGKFADFIKRKNIFWKNRGDGRLRLSDGRHSGPEDSVIFWH